MNTFNHATTDNSIAAVINRAVTTAFSLAMVGAVGVMTTVQYLSSINI